MPPTETSGRASDRVHEQLRAEILSGARVPGARIPSERKLAAELGVSRPAVREALKRLEQAGLVRISHGGATEVLDWRETAGLEILPQVAAGTSIPPEQIARSMIEMRMVIGVDAAARCADRASSELCTAIVELAERAAEAIEEPTLLEELYAQMWREIVLGSDNIAYLLAFTSLMRTLDAYPQVAELVRPSDSKAIRSLGAAIDGRDAKLAAKVAGALLSVGEG